MFLFLFSASACCLIILLISRIIAIQFGLVDKPNNRKLHKGHIPLVGGIAIYLSMCIMYIFSDEYLPHSTAYLVGASILLIVGIIDDRLDLPVYPRIILQALVITLLMIDGAYLYSLGHLLPNNILILGEIGYIITLFAMWASVNAFNMTDGIDGLLGGLTCISLLGISICFYLGNQKNLAVWCLTLIAIIIPYLLLNLSIPFGKKFKVFMGDAGSTLIGFTILWLLLLATQGDNAVIAAVTGLWLIAIPLMDMVTVMLSRILKKNSPFKPDRNHLHHILMAQGLSSRQTLLIIVTMALLLALFGIALEQFKVKELISLLLFLGVFFIYFYLIKKLKLLASNLQKTKEQQTHDNNINQVIYK
ncbi:undecaprenyl-phosphate alpha-N-acetylglucosaminyl 1-phosphate transferase [Limnobaculum zhutongyuii]|uniref:Undecaprenyl-phosphate alpha-N-acetylglucosaminyl 1-phosphate transferase n=1 Tax=Limnobaculum zhutongyuii TaxID=2498113 RepID=A0A411WG41_9GAMM|nr:UDP-N-acetylglucosamine--undecaprenyl-phosphate N-acetylglucosaminephosphotransferase [Limnobaculum zhutongyuii]QBH95173.1 undecaprenyl-phosphate alpha-N-acetylglucosaminyl 1-phosphate transferase [Limnobaculum zhutongyuii]TQS86402.1 undecaprenyl-phosphate alpha-N-acetylglucosaminyl 1-phosphate transferase [Limnobaculum zhutongyuii]